MEDKNNQVGGFSPSDANMQSPSSAGLSGNLGFDPQALSADPVASAPLMQDMAVRSRGSRIWVRWMILLVAALVLVGAVAYILVAGKRDKGALGGNASGRFETTVVPLDNIHVEPIVNLSNTKLVTINGTLTVKEGLIVAPTVQPANAEVGQIYYDINSNTLAYFNGTSFVSVGGTVVNEINDLTGRIPLGAGLADVNGQIVNTGVLSVQGQTGDVALTAGSGITINGTNIANNGVISLTSTSPTLVVNDDGSGNFSLSLTGGGTGTVTSLGGTPGRIAKFTTAQNIEDSLLSESGGTVTVDGNLTVNGSVTLTSPLSVANGGTGAASLGANGVLVGNGTGSITSVVSGVAGMCLVSTAGAPTWATCNPPSTAVNSLNGLTGTLTIANATGLVDTITIDDASTSNKGIAQFNGTNFSVAGGNVNTIQNISTGSSPTFNSLTLSGNLTVQGGTSTLGTLTQAGSLVVHDGSSNTVTIVAANLSADRVYTLPDAGGDATLCVTAGNCIGGSGGAPNGADYLVATLNGTLTNERALANGSNITLTDGGANGNFTVATVQNPTFTTSVTTPALQSSGALVLTSAAGNTIAIDAATTIELQDSTNITGTLDVSVALNVGTADAFAVNSSGVITAAAGITSSGTIVFSGLNCTGNVNGGALTTNGSGQLICSDDDGGAGGTLTGSGTSGTIPVFNGATSITNSIITQSGTTITVAGDLVLSTDLTVANGGTGVSSFTSNGVLYGNGSGALQVTAAGTGGQVLIANGSGVPTFATFSGDVTVSNTGVTTIQTDSVALGTDTTGDYVTNLGSLTGLSTSGNSGEGSTPTLSVIYGSLANTAVQGNVTLTCPSGTGNLTGGGTSITLGTGGACGNLSTVNNPTFSTSVTTPNLILTGAGSNGTVVVGNLGQGTVYTLPDPGQATADICLSVGNCATAGTAGGDLTGTYPNPTIAKLQGTNLTIASPLAGHILIYNGTNGTWENHAISSDIAISEIGVATIQSNAVALGNDTTGDYVIGLTAGNGVSVTGTSGEGWSPTVAVLYGSTANTAVQGNTSITVSAGTNLTGGGSITLGAGGTVTLNVANSPTFSGNLTVQGGTATVGTTTQQGVVVLHDGSSNTGTIQTAALGQDTVYTLPDPGGSSASICLTTGNCAAAGSAGGDLTGTYPNPTIAKLQGGTLNISSPLAGHILIYNATNSAWENHAVSSDIAISETGVATVQANAVALGTDTTGNYTVGVTAGNGINVTGTAGEGWSPSIEVLYGSTANTAVQGNTGVTVTAGTNLTGGGSITLGAGGTVTLNVTNSPTFSGTLTVQGATATVGTATQQGSLILNDGSSNTGTLLTAALGQDTTYTLPDPGQANVNICLSTGNCAGAGSGVTTTGGTTNTVAKFTGSQAIGDSLITDDGSTVTITGSGNFVVQGGTSTIGTTTQAGTLSISDGSSNTISIVATGVAANRTYTLPDAGGAADFCLSSGNCVGGSGGAPNAADYLVLNLNGTLSNERALTAGSNISFTDGGANSTLTVATVQNPTFTTSVTTPTLQSSGALAISSGSGTVSVDATTTIELQDSTNVTGSLDVSAALNVGAANAFAVNSSGAITAATGITSSGTITFSGLNCTTFANGGTVTTNASGVLSCSDDDGAAANTITGTGTSGTVALFSGTNTIADSIVTQTGGNTISIAGTLNLTNDLTVANGGTGASTFTSNGVLYGNGTGAIQVTAAGTGGQVLIANATGVPTFATFSGDVTVSNTGVTTIQANSVALGTDTTGDYIANIGTLTGLSTTGNSGEGSTPTLSVLYGSTANTAVQGNTTLTCPSGTGNLTGGGTSITLGTGGTCANLNTVNNPTFSTSVTTPSLILTGAGSNGSLVVANLGQGTTYTLPDPGQATATICLSTGNCTAAGAAGGDLTGTYPNPTIAKLQGGTLNISTPTGGHVLIYNSTNSAWENHAVSGDIAISETGVATVQANSVALGTDTTGNYVATLGTLTGLTTSGNTGEGSTPTLSVTYGSGANTSVQGNTSITVTAGTNLTGGGSITLGSGGTVTLNVASSPTFSGTLTVQGATATVGTTSQQGSLVLNDGSSNTGTIQTAALAQNTTYTLPDPGGASASICLSTGNCTAVGTAGGDLTGTYPNPTIAKLQGTTVTTASVVSGNILQYNGTAWVNQSISGDVALNSSGVATIQANSVTLGTDTTGNYVATIGTLTGLSTTGNTGEGSTPTLSVLYGSSANTAVQGNVSLTCPSGTGNLSGGGTSITLGTGGTCGNIAITNSPTFTGTLTVNTITPSSAMTIGAITQNLTLQGNATTKLTATDSGFTTTVGFTTPTANTTLNFPALAAGTYNICTSSGNCAGAGVTLQTAYNNSATPEITLDATRAALTIRDNSTPLVGNLFEVQNNNGSTTYFAVDNTGISTTGASTSSGNVNTTGGAIQTNSTSRIANNGDLVNIGNLTATGAITISSTGATNDIILNSADTIELQDATNVTGAFSASGIITATTLGSANTVNYLCRNSTNQISTCNTTGTGAAFVQDGNSFGATAVLGTNDNNGLNFEVNNTAVAMLSNTGAATFRNSTNSTSAFQIQNALGLSGFNIDTTTTNVITNPSFETNTTGWTAKGGATLSRITTQSYDNDASLQAATTAAIGDGAKYNFSLASSTQYSLSFYLKTSVGGFNAFEIGYSNDGSTDTSCSTNIFGETSKWGHITCTFTTGATSGTPYIYVKQLAATARNIYIDAVSLETGATATPYRNAKASIQGSLAINVGPTAAASTGSTLFVQSNGGGNGVVIRGNGDGSVLQSALLVETADGTDVFYVNDTAKGMTIQGGSSFFNTAAAQVISTNAAARALDVQGASSQTADLVNVKDNSGAVMLSVGATGAVLAKNTTNSTTAFQVQNANGNNLLSADTTNTTVSVSSAGAAAYYGAKTDSTVGTTAKGVATGDFDKDGDLDYVVTNSGSGNANILLNNGSGVFSAGATLTTGTTPRGVVTGDFDKDGDIDIAVVNNGSNTLSIFLNTGTGTFAAPATPSTGASTTPVGIVMGDFDKDGDPDLAVSAPGTDVVVIMTNNGSGTFAVGSSPSVGAGCDPGSIVAGDVDKDGDIDLITGCTSFSTIHKLTNNGSGTFTDSSLSGSVGNYPTDMALADTDKDGDLDLVVANSTTSTVSIISNTGTGSFPAASLYYTTGTTPQAVAVTDLDKDGDPDIIVTNSASNTVSYLINLGNSLFVPKVDLTTGTTPWAVATGDFDKDGAPDIVVTNSGTTTASVFLSNILAVSPTASPTLTLYTGGINDAFTVKNADGTQQLRIDAKGNLVLGSSTTAYYSADSSVNITNSGLFADKALYSLPTSSEDTTSGDFNKDGYMDVAVSGGATNMFSVFLGNGDGTFGTRADYVNGSVTGFHITSGDFDKDGDLDIAVTNRAASTMSIFLNDGSGVFTFSSNPATGTNPEGIVATDIDKDGDLDLVTANGGAGVNTVSVFTNNGSGTFALASSPAAGTSPEGITAGDFDKDGDPDLAVVDSGGTALQILTNNGSGTFSTGSALTTGSTPLYVTAGDFDRDGDLDLAVSNWGGLSRSVSVFINNGSGSFAAKVDYPVGIDPAGITSADFNQDGNLDIAVNNYSSTSISILAGVGNGTFAAKADAAFDDWAYGGVAAADFDRDGDLDLAAGTEHGYMAVIFNTTLNKSRFKILSGDGSLTNFEVNDRGVYVGSMSADSTGALLVLDTKNTTGDPTGVNGAMYYNSAYGRFRCYQNDVWLDCIGGGNSQAPDEVTFTSNNTFTKSSYPGLVGIKIRVQGAGGGGGGRNTTTLDRAGGGGAGGYCEEYIAASSLSASETVTVGAAGTGVSAANGNAGTASSFGSHCTANGGSGGAAGSDESLGGNGGSASGGDLNISGQNGQNASDSAFQMASGSGGDSQMGAGGRGRLNGATGQGVSATGYGAGGGGALGLTTNAPGGDGGAGVVVVELVFSGDGTASAAEYLRAQMNADQSTNVSSNDHVKFNQVQSSSGSDITLDTTTAYTSGGGASVGRFTLTAGKTYKLNAVIPRVVFSGANSSVQYQWYNVTSGAGLGTSGGSISTTWNTTDIANDPYAETIITPSVTTVVELRLLGVNGTITTIGDGGSGRMPSAFIEVLGDGTKVAQFQGATVSLNGASGFVPMPTAGQQGSFLLGDGTWSTGVKMINNATQLGISDTKLFNATVNQGSDATTRYYQLGQFGTNNGEFKIEGILAGHTKTDGKGNVDIKLSARDGFMATGTAFGLINKSDILVYYDGVSTYTVWLKTGQWALANIDVTTITASATWDGTYQTTTPSGTLTYTLSTDTSNVMKMDNNGGITIQTSTDTTGAFNVKNAAGNNVISIDTSGGNQNNLITNPSFETNTTGWAAYGTPTTFARDTTQHYSGVGSLKVTTQAAANQGAKYNVTLTNSTNYRFDFYAKMDSSLAIYGTSGFSFTAGYAADGVTETAATCDNTFGPAPNTWTLVRCVISTPASHSGTPFVFIKYGGGFDTQIKTGYVDGVILQTDANADGLYREGKISLQGAISSPVIIQNSTNSTTAFAIQDVNGSDLFSVDTRWAAAFGNLNTISNGDFETNTAGWAASGGSTIVRDPTNAWSGTSALKVTTGTAAKDGAKFITGSNLPTRLDPTDPYRLGFYAKKTGGTFTDFDVDYSADGTAASETSCTLSSNTVNGTWAYYSCQINPASTPDPPSASSYIVFKQTGAGTSHTFWIDGIINTDEYTTNPPQYGAGRIKIGGVISSPVMIQNSENSTEALIVEDDDEDPVLTVDTVNRRVIIGSVGQRSGSSFVATTLVLDNISSDPTGINGAMYYNTTNNRFRCYQSSEWRDCVSSVSSNGIGGGSAFPSGTTTSTTYVNVPGGASALSFTKKSANTKLTFQLNMSFYVTVANKASFLAINLDGTDYECMVFWFNQVSVHHNLSCNRVITGITAGSKTAQVRWKVDSGGSMTGDSGDRLSLTVLESD